MGPFEFNYSLKWSRMQPDHYNLNTAVTRWTWLCSVFYYCSTALKIFVLFLWEHLTTLWKSTFSLHVDTWYVTSTTSSSLFPCVQQALNYLKLCKLEVSFLGIGIGYSRCLCPWSICDLELDHYIICCGWLWPWRTLLCCVHLSPNPCPTRQQQLCSVSFLQGRNVNGKSITPVINNPFSMREVKHGQQWLCFFRKFS